MWLEGGAPDRRAQLTKLTPPAPSRGSAPRLDASSARGIAAARDPWVPFPAAAQPPGMTVEALRWHPRPERSGGEGEPVRCRRGSWVPFPALRAAGDDSG